MSYQALLPPCFEAQKRSSMFIMVSIRVRKPVVPVRALMQPTVALYRVESDMAAVKITWR